MALRIWLPLNGNIDNQGLSNYRFINSGATINNNGKIGKCYSFDGSTSRIYTTNFNLGENFTMALWAKPAVAPTGSHWLICLNDSAGGGSDVQGGIYFAVGKIYYDAGSQHYFNHTITANTWYHVTLTKQGTTLSFYLNGELIETSTGASITRTNLTIGARAGNSADAGTSIVAPFNGYINDVRVYDECLSPKMIKEISKGLVSHYKLAGVGANENLILRSDKVTSGGNGTGITRTYMADGSMKVVSEAGNGNYCSLGFAENSNTNVGDNLSVGDTYTISCDIKVEEGTNFPTLFINTGNAYKQLGGPTLKLNTWQRVYYTSTWGEPGTQYGNISLHLGFSSAIGTYYFKNFKLEKGNLTSWTPAPTDALYSDLGYDNDICVDVSGYNYTATKSGTLVFDSNTTRYSGSTKFNSGYLHLIPSPFTSNSNSFTISCWFKPDRNSTMAIYNNRTGVSEGIAIFYISGKIRFDTGGSSSNSSTASPTVNQWNFITCVYDNAAGIKKIYINGEEDTSTSSVGNLNTVGTKASIGNSSTSGSAGAGNQMYGWMSDFRIYATALSADQIKELYHSAGFIDNKDSVYAYEFREE